MKRVMNWLKSTGISKILTAVIAGLLLFITTACNTPSVLAKTSDQIREEVPSNGLNSRYQGGMNDYSDIDPRTDTKAAKTQAKGLIDNAKSNVIDMTDDLGTNTQRTLDKKGENLDQFGDNVKRSTDKAGDKTKNSAKDFAEGTKRGTENVKQNTQNATKGLAENANRATDDVSQNSRNTSKNVVEGSQRAAGKVGDYLQDRGK